MGSYQEDFGSQIEQECAEILDVLKWLSGPLFEGNVPEDVPQLIKEAPTRARKLFLEPKEARNPKAGSGDEARLTCDRIALSVIEACCDFIKFEFLARGILSGERSKEDGDEWMLMHSVYSAGRAYGFATGFLVSLADELKNGYAAIKAGEKTLLRHLVENEERETDLLSFDKKARAIVEGGFDSPATVLVHEILRTSEFTALKEKTKPATGRARAEIKRRVLEDRAREIIKEYRK